jgi:hypothetical protein
MPDQQPELDAEKIVDEAFLYFDKFVARGMELQSVLLEGLEPTESGWVISIGFDGKRQETTEPASKGAMAALQGFGNKTTTTVREVRQIYLDNAGNFKKMK